MVAVSKPTRTADLEHLDRLEDKVKMLVTLVGRLKSEQGRAAEEQARLSRDLEAARARIAELEGQTTELGSLRDEREAVRSRVSDLLTQLEGLHLG